MRPQLKARLGAVTAGAGAAVSVVLGPVTNYASETVPGWARNGGVVWAVFAVLAVVSVGLVLLSRFLDASSAGATVAQHLAGVTGSALTAVRFTSLRRPHVDPGSVHGIEPVLGELSVLLRRADGQFAVVCGAGGLGKTTVAATLAEQAEQAGYAVFWIRWQDKDTFVLQMTQVAVACGLDEAELQAARTELVSLPDAVWRRLSTAEKWLLVVDNVDQADMLSEDDGAVSDYRGWVRPDGGGLLLVTSRDTSRDTWGARAHLVELSSLDNRPGARILCAAASEAGSAEEAEKLSERLGGLPLALRSAGTYLSRPGSRYRTFDDYRSALDRELPALLASAAPAHGDAEVARQAVRRTWELSLDQLESAGCRAARPLLRMLSLLADAPIPRAWITSGPLRSVTGLRLRPVDVEAALSGLHQYGLLGFADRKRYLQRDAVQIHPLVREINALLLASSPGVDVDTWRQAAFLRTVELAERITRGSTDWPMARVLAPHVQLLFGHTSSVPEHRLLNVRNRILPALFAAGDFASAVSVARAVYEADQAAYGSDHRRTDKSRHALCGALNHLGMHAEATELLRETLARQTQSLGANHYRTLQTKLMLGTALSSLHQHEEAITLVRETAEQRGRALGSDHDLTLTSRNILGNVLSYAGRYAEAAEIHQRTLELRLAQLGPDAPVVLRSRNNLALALEGLGQNAEAVELFRDTLQRRESAFGPEHPDSLATRHNLAVALLHRGHREEAIGLLRRTLEGRERVLGPDHPATLSTRGHLESALARRAGGHYADGGARGTDEC